MGIEVPRKSRKRKQKSEYPWKYGLIDGTYRTMNKKRDISGRDALTVICCD
jgi:hypothetical protein